jgi:predicted DNA-binding protein
MAEQLPLVRTVKSTFRVPVGLYRRLKIQAVQEGRAVADLLGDAVELYLSRVETNYDESTRSA